MIKLYRAIIKHIFRQCADRTETIHHLHYHAVRDHIILRRDQIDMILIKEHACRFQIITAGIYILRDTSRQLLAL